MCKKKRSYHKHSCPVIMFSPETEIVLYYLLYIAILKSSSFADHLCYLCLMFAMLSRLFIAALWSPERKGLTSWFLFVMCIIVILLLSNMVSWYRCGN